MGNPYRVKPPARVTSMHNGWALESKAIRRVRTPEGAARFHLPIGSVIIGGGGRGASIDGMKPGKGGGDGKVLKNIKIEDSEFEGFDKVRTSNDRVLYIGKFPGEDDITVNDEDDNELESFSSIEEAFAWADKHGDDAAFDDDEDTRAKKIANPGSGTTKPKGTAKPAAGDSGGKKPAPKKKAPGPSDEEKIENARKMYGDGSPQHEEAKRKFGKKTPPEKPKSESKPQPGDVIGTGDDRKVIGMDGKPIAKGDKVRHTGMWSKSPYVVTSVNPDGTIGTNITVETARDGWKIAPGQPVMVMDGKEFTSDGNFDSNFAGKRTTKGTMSGDIVKAKDGNHYKVGHPDPGGDTSVRKIGKTGKPVGKWLTMKDSDLTVVTGTDDDPTIKKPDVPEPEGPKVGEGTGASPKDFKPGDRVTDSISGRKYKVTGKPDRNGNIPVQDVNEDGSDNEDGMFRRIPAKYLAKLGDGGSSNGEAAKPKRGTIYKSKKGTVRLEVTDVDEKAGKVYGYPVDEDGKRKNTRRMSGPLSSFGDSFEEVGEAPKRRFGPDTPEDHRKAAEKRKAKAAAKNPVSQVDDEKAKLAKAEKARADQIKAAGRYGSKVESNYEAIDLFAEVLQDPDRTEENRQGIRDLITRMEEQNRMYTEAAKLDEKLGRLYIISQPPRDMDPEEEIALRTYGKLILEGDPESALAVLKAVNDPRPGDGVIPRGSSHIQHTVAEVARVVKDRETAAHGGVPRPDGVAARNRLRAAVAVGWVSDETRERYKKRGDWTSSMEMGYQARVKYLEELAEWEKLAQKSAGYITERKDNPMGSLQYKAVPIGSVDESDRGVVETIVAVTGIKDNVNDIIMPGAFQKSLTQRTPKGVWHHNITDSVSRTEEIKELAPGDPGLPATLPNGEPWPDYAGALKVKTRFNLNTTRGRDAYEDVKFFGTDQEWSIGYNVPTGGATIDKKTGVRHIHSLDLYEYSPVLFGAMPNARTQSVKSAQETWAAIARLDSDDPYDMEIKSLFEGVVAEEKGKKPWEDDEDGEIDIESTEVEDDAESSDDPDEDDDNGFPFAKRKKPRRGAGKSLYSPEAIDRVDRAVKSLAELRDFMLSDYKAFANDDENGDSGNPKNKFPPKKKFGDQEDDQQGDESDQQDEDQTDENGDEQGDEAGEMYALAEAAGLEDMAEAAQEFDQAVASGDDDAMLRAASDILDVVEAQDDDVSDNDDLKAIVQMIADAASGSGNSNDNGNNNDGGNEKPAPKKPPFGNNDQQQEEKSFRSGRHMETKTMVINPADILDAIG